MSGRGFTLVELLIALVVGLGVAGGALLLAGAARSAITVEPVATDTVRRLHAGVDAIAAAIAGAGGERGIGTDSGTIWSGLPALRLITAEGDRFTGLVATRVVQGGRGRLVEDQPGPGAPLTLSQAAGLCPVIQVVCGFRDGDVAVVFDGRGHFDVFIVDSVASPRLTPRAPLGEAYRAGAWVVEVRQERLVLVPQPDGSQILTRLTAAGAREPMVDGVVELTFRAMGRAAPPGVYTTATAQFAQYGLPPPAPSDLDAESIFAAGSHCMVANDAAAASSRLQALSDDGSGLASMTVGELEDGPWCPHEDSPARFDADWFRVRRVDVELRVEAMPAEFRGPAGPWFSRSGTALHDAPRWVRDRKVTFRVAVGR
jgi:prepilin-type N-terminal cleavage/methylation domain-containing protein